MSQQFTGENLHLKAKHLPMQMFSHMATTNPTLKLRFFRDKSAAISHLMVCVYVRVNSHVCEIHNELVLTFTFVKSYYFSFEA